MDADSTSVERVKNELIACRQKYKQIEFFVEYFFENRIKIFNQPPVYEIEEPYMEYQHPLGMQVMESLLYDEYPFRFKKELSDQAEVIYTTAQSLNTFLHDREIKDEEILESIRLELVRITTLGITGYDAPELKTGIAESEIALNAVGECLQPYLLKSKNADSVRYFLEQSISLISQHHEFDSFDRIGFLTEAMLPLQEYMGKMISESGLLINTGNALNYSASNIFSSNALNIQSFSASTINNDHLVKLGKELFFEKRLSGNGKRSCATCHAPEKYFTDGLAQSLNLNETGHVKRNAPTILYASYQHAQFHDARVKTLEEQVFAVLTNEEEMNADFKTITRFLNRDKQYGKLFTQAFPGIRKDTLVSIDRIASALAAFERSLPVMTSAFDKYMQGNKTALNTQQKNGFNLFMGKAMCGTCHFAPLFNGLLPPLYNITEFESLGVTANNNLGQPMADIDSGRYHVYPIEFYAGAFKTPTVRNIEHTAPYMHNGAFTSLDQVMEFYNKGGGNGLGLNNPYQTLSSKPLNLTDQEIKDIIEFLKSLSDEKPNLGII